MKFGWGGTKPEPRSAPRRDNRPSQAPAGPPAWGGLPAAPRGCRGGHSAVAPWAVPWVLEATVPAGSRVLVARAIPPSSPPRWVSPQPVINGPREAVVAAGHG